MQIVRLADLGAPIFMEVGAMSHRHARTTVRTQARFWKLAGTIGCAASLAGPCLAQNSSSQDDPTAYNFLVNRLRQANQTPAATTAQESNPTPVSPDQQDYAAQDRAAVKELSDTCMAEFKSWLPSEHPSPSDGIKIMKAKSDAGHACGSILLMWVYQNGYLNVPQNASLYRFYFSRAVKQSESPILEGAAGEYYWNGDDGFPIDRKQALFLLRKAAAQGSASAQHHLDEIANAESAKTDQVASGSEDAATADRSVGRVKAAIEAKARLENNNSPRGPGHYSALLAIWNAKDGFSSNMNSVWGQMRTPNDSGGVNGLANLMTDFSSSHVVDIRYVNGYWHQDEYVVIANVTTSMDGKIWREGAGMTKPISGQDEFTFVRSEQGWILKNF